MCALPEPTRLPPAARVLLCCLALTMTGAGQIDRDKAITSGEEVLAYQPTSVVTRLLDRHVVVLGPDAATPSNQVVAYVLFDATLPDVYSFLAQTTRQIEFRPELVSIEPLGSNRTGPVDRHRVRILFHDFVYHIQWQLDPARNTLRWELDRERENDLAALHGSWELFAFGHGRALGRFTSRIDVGRGIPSFLQHYITKKNLPRTMEHNRRWVDSGGTYRPVAIR